jgi:hypothetical protein
MAGLGSSVIAQDIPQSQVPSLVLNAFQLKYSNVTDLEWELKDDLYKAEFEIGTRDHDLWIDNAGNIKKHKEDFPKGQLPSSVRKKIASEFKDYKIDDVDKIQMDKKVLFQVDLDGPRGDREVLFTADGEIHERTID